MMMMLFGLKIEINNNDDDDVMRAHTHTSTKQTKCTKYNKKNIFECCKYQKPKNQKEKIIFFFIFTNQQPKVSE